MVLFKNGNVITMEREEVLSCCDVLVKDGKIVSVGEGIDAQCDKVIDCTGKYVMPALNDMHFHAFFSESLTYALSYGVCNVLNLAGYPSMLKWRQQVLKGKREGAYMFTSSPILDGIPDSLGMGFPIVKTKEQAREAVIKCQNDGYDYIKIYNNLSMECYEEIKKTADEIGIRVFGHLPNVVNMDYTHEDKDYPILQETIEHLLFLNDNNVEKCAKEGVIVDPTFIVENSYRGKITDASMAEQEKYINKQMINFVWKKGRSSHKTPQKGKVTTVRKPQEDGYDKFEKFLKAGGRVLLGTDTGFPNVMPGFALHEELEEAVMHGMTNYNALRAVTSDAMDFLEVENKGRIKEGCDAEILVLNANPLENILNTREIYVLYNKNKCYQLSDLIALRYKMKKKNIFLSDSPLIRRLPIVLYQMAKKNAQAKKMAKKENR